MNFRLIKKSIIMVPCIILVAAIIVLASPYANADREDSLLRKNRDVVAAWLSGGSGIARGFSTLNQTPEIIVIGLPKTEVCVTVANLGKKPIEVASYLNTEMLQLQGTVEPEQTKVFCLPSNLIRTSLGLMQINGGDGGNGLALWQVHGGIQPTPFLR